MIKNKVISMNGLEKVVRNALQNFLVRDNLKGEMINTLMFHIHFCLGLTSQGEESKNDPSEIDQENGYLVGKKVASLIDKAEINLLIGQKISAINDLLRLQSCRKGKKITIPIKEVNSLIQFFDNFQKKYSSFPFTTLGNTPTHSVVLEKNYGLMTDQELIILGTIFPNQDNLSLIANESKLKKINIAERFLIQKLKSFSEENPITPLMKILDDTQQSLLSATRIHQRVEGFRRRLQTQISSMNKDFLESPGRVSSLYPRLNQLFTQLERTMIAELETFQNALDKHLRSLEISGKSKATDFPELNEIVNILVKDCSNYMCQSLKYLVDTITEIHKIRTQVSTTHFITLKSNVNLKKYFEDFFNKFEIDPNKKTFTWLGSPITEQDRLILNTVLPDPDSQDALSVLGNEKNRVLRNMTDLEILINLLKAIHKWEEPSQSG